MLFFGAGRGAGHAFESPRRQLLQKQEDLVAARAAGRCGARVLVQDPCKFAVIVAVRLDSASIANARRPPPTLQVSERNSHAGSAASADAARAAAQEAGKALSANSAQASKAAADAFSKYSETSAAGLADASKLIGKNTGEAIKASSKAIDSVSSSVKAMGPSVDKAAASISKGADQFVASASDFGGQIQASTGELSEALKEFTSNSAEFSDGARLAAADAVDALGTAGSAASAAYYDAVASAAAAGIGGAEAASAGAVLIAAAAFGTKGIDAAAVKSLELDRDTAKQESDMLKVKLKELEEKFFLADAQFEQTMAATRKVLTQRMLKLILRVDGVRERRRALHAIDATRSSLLAARGRSRDTVGPRRNLILLSRCDWTRCGRN